MGAPQYGAGVDLNYGSDHFRAEEFGIWFNQGDFCGLPSSKVRIFFFFSYYVYFWEELKRNRIKCVASVSYLQMKSLRFVIQNLKWSKAI